MSTDSEFKDLGEFFDKWDLTKEVARRLAASDRVSAEEGRLISAMIFVIDRVGPGDLESDGA